MVGFADLVRFCDETAAIAGGDVEEQMRAWGMDHDEFMQFVTGWSQSYAASVGIDYRVIVIALFAGWELGYRSCLEAAMADG